MNNKILPLVLAVSAGGFLTACGGEGGGSDSSSTPTRPGAGTTSAIAVVTATGGTHMLQGYYSTDCYGSPDGRIDSLKVTDGVWDNSSNIYAGDPSCTGTPSASGTISATIILNNVTADPSTSTKQISGWKGQGDIAPMRSDGVAQLKDNETVSVIDLEVFEVNDPSGVFGGGITAGFKTTMFYVFDDTNEGSASDGRQATYRMYRDDGDFASASDPYTYVEGTTNRGYQAFPLLAVSGNVVEMLNTSWQGNCKTDSSDYRDAMYFGSYTTSGYSTRAVSMRSEQYRYATNDGSCSGSASTNGVTNTVLMLDGVVSAATGWADSSGTAVTAPNRQDGTAALSDTEKYTNMTMEIVNSQVPGITDGTRYPGSLLVDDTGSTMAVYDIDGTINADSIMYQQ